MQSILLSALVLSSALGAERVTIQALNSPVKESRARFLVLVPDALKTASDAVYSIEPMRDKLWQNQTVKLQRTERGLEASFVASALTPGNYVLKLRVNPPRGLLSKAADLITGKPDKDEEKLKGEIPFSIDASLEVPDPGEAGKATLEGIDVDKNGVRDDVQRWINEAYASSERLKSGLKQLARDQQSDLLSANDKQLSIAAGHKLLRSQACLWYIQGLKAGEETRKQLDSKVLNTIERVRADVRANANFHGQTVRVERTSDEQRQRCEFDPDTMAN